MTTTVAPNALANAAENVAPSTTTTAPSTPAVGEIKSFDEMMDRVWHEGHKADDAPATTTTTPATTPAPEIQQGGGSPPLPATNTPVTTAPTTTVMPATPAAPVVDAGVAQALAQIAETQRLQMQMALLQQQQWQATQPKAKEVGPPELPDVDAALADFRLPQRKPSENDAAYEQRVQAEIWNHDRKKQAEWMKNEAHRIATEAVNAHRNEITQHQQAAAAAQRYTNLLGSTVVKAGYNAQTPQAQAAYNYADRTLTALHLGGVTAQWGEREWTQAAEHFVKEFASVAPPIAPVPVGAPNLTLVPAAATTPAAGAAPSKAPAAGPPISGGGGGSSVPSAPPTRQPTPGRSFNERMESIFNDVQKATSTG